MDRAALPMDWAFTPTFDVELKTYVLLGYLQRVERRFDERKLYPHLADLHAHLRALEQHAAMLDGLAQRLSSDLLGWDAGTGAPVRAPLPTPDFLDPVQDVVRMAVPRINAALARGASMRDEFAGRIEFEPVGVLPLDTTEGWLLLRHGQEARAYAYRLGLLRADTGGDALPEVRTRYLRSFGIGLASTLQHIKRSLIESHPELPNPAVFAFTSAIALPHAETFMPLAKQLLRASVGGRA
jgi:hypothetical protein